MINVAIRKLAGTDREYLAYARTFAGRAAYFVYFKDDIWGAMVLHDFTDMLRAVFQNTPLKLTLVDQELALNIQPSSSSSASRRRTTAQINVVSRLRHKRTAEECETRQLSTV